MSTDTSHNRLGRSLIEAAALARALHANGSSVIVRGLNVQLSRALEEYAKQRFPGERDAELRVESDVELATVKLRERLGEAE